MFKIEYAILNEKYDLDTFTEEKPICILAPFRNLLLDTSKGSWSMFMKSINGQNYSNYRVYMIDDFATDNSVEIILE